MNNPQVLLSVIIPVYNTEKHIVKCLSSVLSYQGDDLEVIIVNDGTPDNAMTVLDQNFHDERIHIINKVNNGLSSARNSGVTAAVGKYVLHLDSDDYLSGGALLKIIETIRENDSVDVVVFDINVVDASGGLINLWQDTTLLSEVEYNGKDYLRDFFLGRGSPAIWNKVFLRDLYIDNCIYHPEEISYGEDGSTMPRLMVKAKKIKKLCTPLVNYVQHPSSMMANKNNKLERMSIDYKIAFSIVDDYIRNSGECKWYLKYSDTFKIKYLYDIVRELYMFSPEIRSSKIMCEFYRSYMDDVKDSRLLYSLSSTSDVKFYLVCAMYKIFGYRGDYAKWCIVKIVSLFKSASHMK